MLNAKIVADTLLKLERFADAQGWNGRDCGYCSRYLSAYRHGSA
jgi:hypothetical protein